MATSNGPILVSEPAAPNRQPDRQPIRLRMAADPARRHLDGGWWPRSRDVATELSDLVDHVPVSSGRIIRALISRGDWDAPLRRIPVRGGHVKVGLSRSDDTHLVVLTTSERTMLCVLVVPPEFTQAQGQEALLPSSIAANDRSATDILREAVERADMEPFDHWIDDGGSWSGGSVVSSSAALRRHR